LITPSLDEMAFVAEQMQRRGMNLPLMIGGATTSQLHTAVKIAPGYESPVIHVKDASLVTQVCNELNGEKKSAYVSELRRLQGEMREAFARRASAKKLLPLTQARLRAFKSEAGARPEPGRLGVFDLDVSVRELLSYVDWSPFFWTWDLKGKYPAILQHPKYGSSAQALWKDAQALLKRMIDEDWTTLRARIGIFKATSVNETVNLENAPVSAVHFMRQQAEPEKADAPLLSLADFIAPSGSDYLGAFAVTSGEELGVKAREFETRGDDYSAIIVKALADRLAEGLAEYAHLKFRELCGLREDLTVEQLIKEEYDGIRPAPGYAACPDHTLKGDIWKLLGGSDKIGARLTESFAMAPAATVAGFMFLHPAARYFSVGTVGEDQWQELARLRNTDPKQVERFVAFGV
ncbi:MAG TPA: vitamin B12 dependent-methionine synthase activation domain-containing protein, partial [Bdellovibrionales bacterium]|nr:vitamin B12 dependent-methionine synthase activation domain-containing protein [Bdellovibrionales bacterium]